jgi:FKBP-type peptidyl-prolyl cis-trans isomerase
MKKSLLRFRCFGLALGLLLAAPALWSCNTQTSYQKQLAEHENQMKIIDEDTIQSYLRRNQLLNQSTRTNSGLYVVNITSGTGTPVTTGRQVSVKYIGRFLSSGAHPASSGYAASYGDARYPAGAIFDNSTENRSNSCGCAVFTAGSGAIAGFSEGLLLMRKGDRKLLLIPSRLAYGPAGSTNIPPDSALMFDVEILDVY